MKTKGIFSVCVAVLLIGFLVGGQTPPAPTPPATSLDSAQSAPEEMTEENMILEGESLYRHGGERDPFSPLIRSTKAGGGAPVKVKKGTKGISRFTVDACILEGIVKNPEGSVAWFQGNDLKAYKVKTGDNFADGVVLDISYERGEVMVQQELDDPTAIKPFRNVSLKIRSQSQEGEAK